MFKQFPSSFDVFLLKVYDPTQVHPIPHGKQMRSEHSPGEIFYTPVSGIWYVPGTSCFLNPYKGGLSAIRFHIVYPQNFGNLLICRLSANVTLCVLAICGPNLFLICRFIICVFAICGPKLSANTYFPPLQI